jgi:hypothetical protein
MNRFYLLEHFIDPFVLDVDPSGIATIQVAG